MLDKGYINHQEITTITINQQTKQIETFTRLKMAGSQALVMAVLVMGIAFHSTLIDATIAKSMYFNWGAHHSSILGNGDDLRLVLDQTSGIQYGY